MDAKPGWGGARTGSGRPRLGDTPLVRCTITLTPEQARRLRELGRGNVSEGVRRLLERFR